MTTSDKLREIAHKYGGAIITGYGQSSASGSTEMFTAEEQCLSDLTALISEGYVEKHKYDELLRQRDELRERCKQLEFMIEKGLGWDDVKNDISMPHEL